MSMLQKRVGANRIKQGIMSGKVLRISRGPGRRQTTNRQGQEERYTSTGWLTRVKVLIICVPVVVEDLLSL